MASVRKRKMNKSSYKKATRKTKDRQRKGNIQSNAIIAANWDPKLTLAQNYKKLGLKDRLSGPTGGTEKDIEIFKPKTEDDISVEINEDEEEDEEDNDNEGEDEFDPANIPEGTAKIVRDEDGKVTKIIYGTKKQTKKQPKKVEEVEKPKTEVVRQLEELANSRVVRERHLSERETEWIEKLYNKYGDNYMKMQWDKKLNPFQHSAGNLKKRVIKWKNSNESVTSA
ncbi:hypothetical protein B5S28_g1314 [[Candida] boidinii]|uniref:Unnamed protein product n=1 Tax=Candida boidinii TaxID=5477 RepID=A0ACB5TME1_CANBO|nr:hypothetical protein B5S28_g1314 [[Candida] boidinii]OWB78078.1 hypothetical protein B5S32_g2263 [[Candida] boidinii]GME89478.1 unnamed protein product [[Candida] boidinii]GME91049.1 unnamed protein product [[Candida] boidinii]